MISIVHDESRTIPPRRRCSTARVAHLEETVATPEIRSPEKEFDEIE
jgi:hypothetical protein